MGKPVRHRTPSRQSGAARKNTSRKEMTRGARRRLMPTNAQAAHDLRRSFAVWLEDAGVPRSRRKLYLGHAAGDVTALCETRELLDGLAEDADCSFSDSDTDKPRDTPEAQTALTRSADFNSRGGT